jgi:hypothetical protein
METAKLYDALDLLGRILLSAIFLFDAWTEINNLPGGTHDARLVFNHNHRIARGAKLLRSIVAWRWVAVGNTVVPLISPRRGMALPVFPLKLLNCRRLKRSEYGVLHS